MIVTSSYDFKSKGSNESLAYVFFSPYVYLSMSDRESTRWQHNRIYPHPISPCVYTYDSRLYCCETVNAHCSNIIKS